MVWDVAAFVVFVVAGVLAVVEKGYVIALVSAGLALELVTKVFH